MSGTSRIGGYGGFSSGGQDKGRSASLARFCRGRKIGDVVSGVFLRLETESLGWALLEGEELLAHLPAEGPRPEPGSPVFFRIEALLPEVVLRILAGDSPAARLAMVFPSLPLSQEAALYASTRDAFEARLAACRAPGDIPEGLAARKEAFARQVSRTPELLAAFAEVQIRSRALLRAGAPAGLTFFRHMPWLSPALSGLEVSLWNRDDAVIANGTLPEGDRLLLQGAMRGEVLRYRLALIPAKGVQPGLQADLQPGAARQAFAHGGIAEYQGVLAAGRGQATDLVGRILALAADSGTMAVGRYSRRL